MRSFRVVIEGLTPLLQSRFPEDRLIGLLPNVKSAKKEAKVYSTPRDLAEEAAYRVGDNYVIPTKYLVGAFREASANYKRKDSSRKSLKSVASGAFQPCEAHGIILCPKTKKPLKSFEVDIAKGTNHLRGAVPVIRPRFDKWLAEMSFQINEHLIDAETVLAIIEDAGRTVGIGAFRVAKGGYFGQFQVVSWKEIKD